MPTPATPLCALQAVTALFPKENTMQIRLPLLRLLTAATLVLGGSAHADLVSVQTLPMPASAEPTPAAAQRSIAFALAAGTSTAGTRLTDTASAVGSLSAPEASTVNLWTFITAVRAQQRGETFALLETQISLFDLVEPTPAPVPLPAAAWFLVMGLLGAAGVRLTGRSGQAGAAPAGLVPVPG